MNWQKLALVSTLAVLVLALAACADSSSKYRDTSELERPPQLPITPAITENASDSKTGTEKDVAHSLENLASIADDSHLIINRPFDVAWQLIGLAADFSGMEVSDKNRAKGQYYLLFDPDDVEQKNGKDSNLLSGLFKADDYPKGRYLLTFYETPNSVKIKAEFLEHTESDHSSQDGYASHTAADNGVSQLLKKLHSALHDDLPAH